MYRLINGVSGFEISTDAPEEIERFYGETFGWKFSEGHGNPYSIIRTPAEGSIFGTLWDNRVKEGSYNWLVICIEVEDVAAVCAKAVEAGGKVRWPLETDPRTGGMEWAHLEDPSGHQIGIYSQPWTAGPSGSGPAAAES
ncbi:VOC family protein [Cryptosporangium japonicum]|uniref:VOC family protein n=1 Tax=Cryptosporangium japonicum TaxID=80872 RepID=A0ABP3D5C7_9ACTN